MALSVLSPQHMPLLGKTLLGDGLIEEEFLKLGQEQGAKVQNGPEPSHEPIILTFLMFQLPNTRHTATGLPGHYQGIISNLGSPNC